MVETPGESSSSSKNMELAELQLIGFQCPRVLSHPLKDQYISNHQSMSIAFSFLRWMELARGNTSERVGPNVSSSFPHLAEQSAASFVCQ